MNISAILIIWAVLLVFNIMGESDVGNEEETELALLQILFRHGDRSPVTVYPKDPNGEYFWNRFGGLGQLTQQGMQQHYHYGQFLRARYGNFLNSTYDRSRVMVKSTNYDRTMMSAESLLASLYQPVDYQVWNQQLLWQPIPVRTAGLENVFVSKCPRYDQLLDEITHSDEYIKTSQQFKDLIDLANKESGLTDVTFKGLWKIADASFIENIYKLKQPKWIEDNFDRFMETRDLDFSFNFRTTEMGKLMSGGILNDMKTNIITSLKRNSTLELALFSAHDTNVAAFIKLLGLDEPIVAPKYTASILVELRRSVRTSKYYVQIYTKNNSPDDEPINPRIAKFEGCDQLCPLEDFMKIIADKIVNDPTKACSINHHEFYLQFERFFFNPTIFVSVIIALVAFFSLFALLCWIQTYRRILRQRAMYNQKLDF